MAIKGRKAQASKPIGAQSLTGKVSWFGGPHDSSDSGKTASGVTTAVPGIAVYNRDTLGGYWLVDFARRKRIVKQTDIGPAPWTGRVVDFTYSILGQFGFTEQNFPTDSAATLTYLGKDKRQALASAGGNAVAAGGGGGSPVDPSSDGSVPSGDSSGGGVMQDASLLGGLGDTITIVKDLLEGNISDLGNKIGVAFLQLTKNIFIGSFEFIVFPAWHWNQRGVAFYTQTILDFKNIGDPKSDYQYAFAWTAAFWAAGYVLLFTDADSKGLKPVPPRQARLAHHVRRAQAIPARRSLIRPRDVRGKTPKKPKETISRVTIIHVDTMTATRPRSVRVTREGETPANARTDRTEPTTSEARIGSEGTAATDRHAEAVKRAAQPDEKHQHRDGSPQGSGTTPQKPPTPRGNDGSGA